MLSAALYKQLLLTALFKHSFFPGFLYRVEDARIRIVESMRAAQTAFKIHFAVGATVRAPVLEAFPKDPPRETALIGSFITVIQLEITAIVLITFR